MKRLIFFLMVSLCVGTAHAQCVGGTNGTPQTPSYLTLNEFQDFRPAGSITPACLRDFIASSIGSLTSSQTSNYTLALTDAGTTVQMALTSDGTLTIPPHSSVAFNTGVKIAVRNTAYPTNVGSVRVAITPGSGVSLSSRGSLIMSRPGQTFVLWQVSQDVWTVVGNEPTKLVNADYALTTTDGSGAANVAAGIMPIWGPNGDGTSAVSCGPGPGVVPGTGTLSSRVATQTTGGPTNGRYRKMSVVSGDNWGGFGVRCEIGNLEWRFGEGGSDGWLTYFSSGYQLALGAFAVFKEGQHRITEFDIRLESTWTLSNNTGFQQVAQWKQAPPSTNVQNSGSPVLEIGGRNNQWQLTSTQGVTAAAAIYTTPAALSTWYRIRLDCYYTQFTTLGWCQMNVTPWSGNALGTPVIGTLQASIQTLAIETGTGDALPLGSSIPSAFMVGPYVRTGAPSMDLDITNIEVWEVP